MSTVMMPVIDLENWMGQLPDEVKKRPLTRVSIPGSHNSGTCDLSSKAGNDAFCVNIPLITRPWATCQRHPIIHQLNHGIRYLDFRLDYDANQEKFFVTHFLRSKSPPMKCLEIINEFLDAHPKEVVIIDFQHFYHFTDDVHDQFLCSALELFGSKVCPVPEQNTKLTLAFIEQHSYQVILINRYQSGCSLQKNSHLFFLPSHFPTFWPDTDSGTRVISTAKMAYEMHNGHGYITQLVVTLQGAKNFVYVDLKNFYKSRLYGKAMSWLRNILGGQSPNIVITDFVEIHNFSFPLAVIKLNYLQDNESLAMIENRV